MFDRFFGALRKTLPVQQALPAVPKIFIAYRRNDSAGITGRIADRLVSRFGERSVFIDVDAIPLGADFTQHLTVEIAQCDVLFAVIGPHWFGESESGRRIDDENDFVRIELEAALSYGKPIIPLLVEGAQLPSAEDFPASLRQLALRNAVRIRSGIEFHRDLDGLIGAVQALLERTDRPLNSRHATIPDITFADLQVKRVFVSHATADREWVEQEIISFMASHGLETWYAKKSITSSTQWEREILRGLEACDWFMLIVSPASSQSEWVKDELNWAFHHRPTRIVPIIMSQCNLWDFHIRLPRLQYIDFTENKAKAQQTILRSFSEAKAFGTG